MSDDGGAIDRGARILERSVPRGAATKAEAVFFYGAGAVFWIIFLSVGLGTLAAYELSPEEHGGLVGVVMLVGPVVIAFVASSVAIRWLRSRSVSPVVGCAVMPVILVISGVLGWWFVPVLLALAAVDSWWRRRPADVQPLRDV